jgi:hypothetical protein
MWKVRVECTIRDDALIRTRLVRLLGQLALSCVRVDSSFLSRPCRMSHVSATETMSFIIAVYTVIFIHKHEFSLYCRQVGASS